MKRLWIQMSVFGPCTAHPKEQCLATTSQSASFPLEVSADLPGRDAFAARFIVRGSCSGEPDAHLRYRVDTLFRGMMGSFPIANSNEYSGVLKGGSDNHLLVFTAENGLIAHKRPFPINKSKPFFNR